MRVLTWNCRRASGDHPLWNYFSELAPDIALLQETTGLPRRLVDTYDVRTSTPSTRSGTPQRFQTAILVRGAIGESIALTSDHQWVTQELRRFEPNLLAYQVKVENTRLNLLGVYAPAWPVSRKRLCGIDLGDVKLTQNADVWVADLLVSALRNRPQNEPYEWIVGGDFNTCETFDQWKNGPRGNREWLDRMAALHFTERLRHMRGGLTPTFRKPGTADASSQIDHLFISPLLVTKLTTCQTGDPERVFGSGLSDHLPIVAQFAMP